ncbi:MAG: hypothetical protein HYY06_30320 [Deltaproteobacteria bacterium]|nr:hypothetical protein [Deltaproteobacteria bacterium]
MSAKSGVFERSFQELEELINDPTFAASSSLQRLYDTQPYRAIESLGLAALPPCVDRIREGCFFLNRAVLRIGRLDAAKLTGKEFASEQEVSAAVLNWYDRGIVGMREPTASMTPMPEEISTGSPCASLGGRSPLPSRVDMVGPEAA